MVSIIICFYEEYEYIGLALNSIRNQIYKSIEIILIDDSNLKINTKLLRVLENFKDLKIIYHKNEFNLGLAKSRNLGIKLSKGDYISFLDSDDEYLPNKINTQYNKIKSKKYDLVYCKETVLKNGVYYDRNCNRSFNLEILLKNQFINLNTLLINKNLIKDNDIYFNQSEESRYGEDLEYLIKLRTKTDNIYFINEYLTISRRRKGNHRNYLNLYKELEKLEILYDEYSNNKSLNIYRTIIEEKKIDIKFKKCICYKIINSKQEYKSTYNKVYKNLSLKRKFILNIIKFIPYQILSFVICYIYPYYNHKINYFVVKINE